MEWCVFRLKKETKSLQWTCWKLIEPENLSNGLHSLMPKHQHHIIIYSFNSFGSGLVYGRLTGTTKYTLKTDIVNLLEGCNLSLEDVKVDYYRSYMPNGM